MKIKTSELTGPALDWVVAKCEGNNISFSVRGPSGQWEMYSTNWSQGGPIVERECISMEHSVKYDWIASQKGPCSIGPTPLIAAMRCYVASKLGDEVDVPDELINN